jgi:8-hydroxy-5-deazaflavin:NADPH oxidoreductase
MFICGNDESARKIPGEILDRFGWETADMGKAEAARAIRAALHALVYSGLLAQ